MLKNIGESNQIGEIFLKCSAKDTVEQCAQVQQSLMQQAFGKDCRLPQVKLEGHLDATFPYIRSHLEYMIGELLRNSIQGTIEHHYGKPESIPAIKILICETPQHVIFRISDQGGGVPADVLPYLWSFAKGPRRQTRLHNLERVPRIAATMQELRTNTEKGFGQINDRAPEDSSLSSLSGRPADLRLGIGLPMSKVYAEYWAGSLEIHSLEGYGTDAFLQVPKLGNKNEQLVTRASMDAI